MSERVLATATRAAQLVGDLSLALVSSALLAGLALLIATRMTTPLVQITDVARAMATA